MLGSLTGMHAKHGASTGACTRRGGTDHLHSHTRSLGADTHNSTHNTRARARARTFAVRAGDENLYVEREWHPDTLWKIYPRRYMLQHTALEVLPGCCTNIHTDLL